MAESITLTRQVAVKAIVTENFKEQVSGEINRTLQAIDTELQQLEFKTKRAIADMEKKAIQPMSAETRAQLDGVKMQSEQERARLSQMKEEYQQQLQALGELPLGSVVTQFTLENDVEVRLGENIFQRLEGGEVLVKDGVIQEIRL